MMLMNRLDMNRICTPQSAIAVFALILLAVSCPISANEAPLSEATQECIDCHVTFAPGMIEDWKKSLHAKTTPAAARKKPELERRISSPNIPEQLAGVAVGCAECHGLNPEAHKDTFDHNDKKVHLTVTPNDCSTCHAEESQQFDQNIMSHAWGNLTKNPVFSSLMNTVNGLQSVHGLKSTLHTPDQKTQDDSCFQCHGTEVQVKGSQTRDTDQGTFEFPVLTGWPNQGVGRINPDGSKGSCSACHNRHQFAIEVARNPGTCAQCHKGPDVPAYKVYSVSKHGALYSALAKEWNFKNVPWRVGQDFSAPTCATCHASLVTTPDGEVIAKRSHRMNDRIPWRLFGLIYSHAHPKSPDTSIIKNSSGLPLPTTLTGESAQEYLIDEEEIAARQKTMQQVCKSCHTTDWVDGHWDRFQNSRRTSDAMVLTATEIMKTAWDKKLADNSNLFDEALEKKWIEQWLFHANSVRLSSAMLGADYGVFDGGRWNLSKNIQDMLDHMKFLMKANATEGVEQPRQKPKQR
jgi:hypothetical protein